MKISSNPLLPELGREQPSWESVIRMLFAAALRLGASLEEAEDLVQDTLEVVVADPDWFDDRRASLGTVLTTVLRNRFIDRRRHHQVQRRSVPHLRLVTPPAARPDEGFVEADASVQRELFLAQLTRAERGVFGAWVRQSRKLLEAEQAAASLGLTVPAYNNAKKRLKRRCKAILAELGIEVSDLFGPDGGAS